MSIKNGTKKFHASAWEYNRNDALDAYSYFLKQSPGAKKAELRYNAYGFNAGGPLEFLSKDPKSFFFYNQEWRKEIQGGAIFKQVPSAANFGFGASGTTVTNAPDMSSLEACIDCAPNHGLSRDCQVRRRRAGSRPTIFRRQDSAESCRSQCRRLPRHRLYAAA